MFAEKPFFGIGTNLYRFKCNEIQFKHTNESCSSHPHNYYLQLLSELGIFGFIFIFIFYLYLIYIFFKQLLAIALSKKNNLISFEALLFPLVIFVYFWPLIPTMSFYNNWNNVLIMLPLGFFMKYYFSVKKNGNINKN